MLLRCCFIMPVKTPVHYRFPISKDLCIYTADRCKLDGPSCTRNDQLGQFHTHKVSPTHREVSAMRFYRYAVRSALWWPYKWKQFSIVLFLQDNKMCLTSVKFFAGRDKGHSTEVLLPPLQGQSDDARDPCEKALQEAQPTCINMWTMSLRVCACVCKYSALKNGLK